MHLLLHHNTTDEERISYLDKLSSQEGFEGVIAKVLEQVKDDQSLSDGQLKRLLDATDSRRMLKSVLETLMAKFLQRGIWNQVKNPYHRAVKVGSLEIVERLTAAGGDPAVLDEDRWSCLDLAKTLGHDEEFTATLKRHIKEHGKPTHETQDSLKPTTLQPPVGLEPNIRVLPYAVEGHLEYTEVEGKHNITMLAVLSMAFFALIPEKVLCS